MDSVLMAIQTSQNSNKLLDT